MLILSPCTYIDLNRLNHNYVLFCESAPLETSTVDSFKIKFCT